MKEPTKTPIRLWAEDDKPREKLMLKGRSSLSDAELIAILINSGNNEESAVELSRRILRENHNNLVELSRLSVNELTKFKGIGEAKAISIIAALELGKRRSSADVRKRKSIKTSKDVFEYFYAEAADLNYEKFWIMLLNQANGVINAVEISEGGISGTVVDLRKIYKIALESNAAGLIICHNHPSGQLKPSQSDLNLTDKIKKSGDLLDIRLLDHVIFGINDFFSFADAGIL